MAMAISIQSTGWLSPAELRDVLLEIDPDMDIRLWPDVGDPGEIIMLAVDRLLPGILGQLPNLKLISYLGYGVDSLFEDPELPTTVPMTRIGGPGIAAGRLREAVPGPHPPHRAPRKCERAARPVSVAA